MDPTNVQNLRKNSNANVLQIFAFALQIRLTICSQSPHNMQKIEVRSRSNFFSNFGDFIGPFNPVFHFHFKNINFFEIGPKLTLLSNIF